MRTTYRCAWYAMLACLALGIASCDLYVPQGGVERSGAVLPAGGNPDGQASLEFSMTASARAESVTEWSLDCISDPSFVDHPDADRIAFEVFVTEGDTITILTITGVMTVYNGGSGDAPVESVIVNLQTKEKGPFYTVSSVACGDPDQRCDYTDYIANDASGELKIFDQATGENICGNLPVIGVDETVVYDYEATFIISALDPPLEEGDHIRPEGWWNFSNAGERGGSGASCPNPQEEGDYLRGVASRVSGMVPPIERVNSQVTFCDEICTPADPAIATVTGFDMSIDDGSGRVDCTRWTVPADGSAQACCTIDAVGTGPQPPIKFLLEGEVTCAGRVEDTTYIENCAELWGDGVDPTLGIYGSPAVCRIDIDCSPQGGGGGGFEEGDFCTQTQGGWGTNCRGGNPGCIRDRAFDGCFPNGLVIGGIYTITFTSSAAVENFLPAGGTGAPLTQDHVDPTDTEAGVFAGQVTALALNVWFDDCDIDGWGSTGDGCNGEKLGDLVIAEGDFADMPVHELLRWAMMALGGDTTPYTISQLNDAATKINECFVDCTQVCDYLRCP